jgi:hypothetical protein
MENRNYIKADELRKQLAISKEQDCLTDEAYRMFSLIAKNMINRKFSYKNDDDRKDCICRAILDCALYWRSYNPEKTDNVFAYFSQIIKFGAAKEFKQLNPRDEENKTQIFFVSINDTHNL